MKVSISWLRDYVAIETPVEELAAALTMAGLEVEAVIPRYAYLEKVKVGRITRVLPHPNADRLRICEVSTGDRSHRIVCGAPNAREGLLAPLALPGAELPGGLTIKAGKIRGERSEGMLCSGIELGIDTDAGGLLELDPGLEVGQRLDSALGLADWTLEIGLTPNRPDCLSLIGVAREIAALQGSDLRLPAIEMPTESGDITALTSVTIEDYERCPRYTARLITGIKVGPSPHWLQDRLLSVGLRPINNLVDITNFVMMETGQPLHAFDFDRLHDQRIVVRTAAAGEKFTTLDEKERSLNSEMLMICDGQRAVGIGGVMGGMNSEIATDTTRVLLESAYFNPVSIRKTAKKLALGTDASHRFERGVDPSGTVTSLNRAAALMADLGGGTLVGGIIDEHQALPAPKTIDLSMAATNRVLGTALDRDAMQTQLERVAFQVRPADEDRLLVTAPSFRVDVSRPEDLMEEIARLTGYNEIPTTFPEIPANRRNEAPLLGHRRRIRTLMAGFGFSETVSYSFIHAASCDRLRLPADDPRRQGVKILNPISEDQTVMRTSLIPSLLETLQRNLAHQVRDVRIFETGRVYLHQPAAELPEEREMLAGLWSGSRAPLSWHERETPCDYFDLKGVVEALCQALKLAPTRYEQVPSAECTYTRAGASAWIYGGEVRLGLIGELHPQVVTHYGLKQSAVVFALCLQRLISQMPEQIVSAAQPRYPAITRDITLIIGDTTPAAEVLSEVRSLDAPLLETVYFFDRFSGGPIPEGNVSLSFRLVYRAEDRTLTDEDISALHQQISDHLVARFGADLPA
ncbi:MAG: phenylalanine--tRNA ligase subunit beta [Desulfosarcinaceae bacterium]|nr:phenylalanine--tRNA ligase subunit beta [Desulfosarcinaceae bacterium]